jgi:hypothetical protein
LATPVESSSLCGVKIATLTSFIFAPDGALGIGAKSSHALNSPKAAMATTFRVLRHDPNKNNLTDM